MLASTIDQTTSQLENTRLDDPATPLGTTASVREEYTPDASGSRYLSAVASGRRVDRDDEEDDNEIGEGEDEAVHFVLLAEFDIDLGSTISQQYPYPTGTDEQ